MAYPGVRLRESRYRRASGGARPPRLPGGALPRRPHPRDLAPRGRATPRPASDPGVATGPWPSRPWLARARDRAPRGAPTPTGSAAARPPGGVARHARTLSRLASSSLALPCPHAGKRHLCAQGPVVPSHAGAAGNGGESGVGFAQEREPARRIGLGRRQPEPGIGRRLRGQWRATGRGRGPAGNAGRPLPSDRRGCSASPPRTRWRRAASASRARPPARRRVRWPPVPRSTRLGAPAPSIDRSAPTMRAWCRAHRRSRRGRAAPASRYRPALRRDARRGRRSRRRGRPSRRGSSRRARGRPHSRGVTRSRAPRARRRRDRS